MSSSNSRNPQIYVGGVSRRTRGEDLEKAFEKYGKIRDFSFKSKYAFIVSKEILLIEYRNSMTITQLERQLTEWMARTSMVRNSLLSQPVSLQFK